MGSTPSTRCPIGSRSGDANRSGREPAAPDASSDTTRWSSGSGNEDASPPDPGVPAADTGEFQLLLSTGELADTRESLAVVEGDALSDEEVAAVTDRLPGLVEDTGDRTDFRRPAESLPPPRVGRTVEESFGAADGDEPPDPETGPLEVLRHQPDGAVAVAPSVSVTRRLAGLDRYETSVRVAESLPATAAILARGDAFPDALAAAEIGGAVLLTAGREVPDSVRAYLDERPEAIVYAVGGDAAAAEPSATPIVGADRYDTAARVATRFFTTPPRSVVASGEKFPDAVAGGTIAALTGSPLLLATTNTLPSSGAQALRPGSRIPPPGHPGRRHQRARRHGPHRHAERRGLTARSHDRLLQILRPRADSWACRGSRHSKRRTRTSSTSSPMRSW